MTSQARSVLQDLGLNILPYEKQIWLINANLLPEFAFCTVKYYDLSLYAQTLQAWSVLQDLGLNILLYKKQTQLINWHLLTKFVFRKVKY